MSDIDEKSLQILDLTNKVTDGAFTIIKYFQELHANNAVTLSSSELQMINEWLSQYYGLATYVNKINNNAVVH